MRFTAERDALLTAVKRASSVVMARNTIPVLACVHIAATDTGVKVCGYGFDEWVTAKADAAVAEGGAVCIDAVLLGAWITASPKGALIGCRMEGTRAVLTAGRSVASFETLASDQFPTLPERDAKTEIPDGIDAMKSCAPYAGNEEPRHYLNGVAINRGHAVATNGHILCAVDIKAPEVEVIIPNAGVRQLLAAGKTARLFIGQNTWACEDGPVLSGGKLIEGTFPDWKRAVPENPPVVSSLDADDMADAVTQVQIASVERARAIVLESDGSAITINCQGNVMEAEVSVTCDGVVFRVGLNSKYALTAMKTFAGRVVKLAQADSNDPVVLTCDAAPELLACVFPMRV